MEKLKMVAVAAAREAGIIARKRFMKNVAVMEKGQHGDIVTEVDQLAEKHITKVIIQNFPDHQIKGEEFGLSGKESDWLWLIDPLDGTNNFAIGIPMYGVSITVIYRKNVVLGVIYDSHLDQIYIAEAGVGSFRNKQALRIREALPLKKMSVGWIQGHVVQKNTEAALIKSRLESEVKRVISLWAPSLLWCMLARGDLQGIVLYNSEGEDLYSGVLMAREAGACIVDFQGSDFYGINPEPYLIACHPDMKDELLGIVQNVRSSLNN